MSRSNWVVMSFVSVSVLALACEWAMAADSPASQGVPATSTAPATSSAAILPITYLELEEEVPVAPQVLAEDPNMRMLGLSPMQMLYAGIGAIIVFNMVGWLFLWRAIAKERREDQAAAA